MNEHVFFIIFLFFFTAGKAQDSSISIANIRVPNGVISSPNNPDLPSNYPYNKNRVKLITAANVVGYGGIMVGLYATWYKKYPQSKFHVFNDFPEWKQIDKMGHAYSAYAGGKASMELWRWTGIDRKKRIWIAGLSGTLYETVIETLDGFSSQWGWSWGDIGANLAGSALLIGQELGWDEQRIQFKWSFHRKHYPDPVLNTRTTDLFGSSDPERFLKDYNGQTYWLSINLKSFSSRSRIPAWLLLSIGTGAEGLFGGRENIGKDKEGNIEFYRPDVKRYRQWYLAPDIDLTKIRTNKKLLKLALRILNIFKFPHHHWNTLIIPSNLTGCIFDHRYDTSELAVN